MQASLDAIVASKAKGTSAAAVTVDGLLIASSNASASVALTNADASTVALLAMEALKLNSDATGFVVPSARHAAAAAPPAPAAVAVLPYTGQQQRVVVAAENCSHSAMGSDERGVADAVARDGFEGIVIETDRRTIQCTAVSAAAGADAAANSAFLVVAQLLA